jgi:hypothetical protein
MTETETSSPDTVQAPPPELPPTEAAPAGDTPEAAPPPRRPRRVLPFLATVLFLLLAAAVGWLWEQQQELGQQLVRLAEQPRQDATAEITTLRQRLDGLERQFAALPQRPPAAVDLGPLEARIAALEQHPAQQAAAPDLGPLQQKLDSVAAEAAAARQNEAAMADHLAELTRRLDAAEQRAGQLAGRAAEAERLARAQVALDAGEPLGDIPGAPPALARFAHAKPPTEAQLRLAFPAAAAAAEKASVPPTAGKSFGERMWLRARSLVTVKQGDRVVLGPPAAEVLGQAEARLDAGDLAGAVAALNGLDGAAAQAMASWRAEAQSLLDARAALAQLARS